MILKGLLIFLSKKSFKIDSVEFQAYHKWFNQLIKTLSKSSKYQSICMEIFSVCIDIDLKLIENNLNEILTNVFTQNKCLDENFHKAYAQFLEKTLNTFAKYQRILKFITR